MMANGRLHYYRHDGDRAYVLHAMFPEKSSIAEHAAFFTSMVEATLKGSDWLYVSNNFLRYN